MPRLRGSVAFRLLLAMGSMVIAGAVTELLLVAGAPRLAAVVVLPALAAVLWLWRPRLEALAAMLLVVGLELLIPLQTGGGRYNDWFLHYGISLHYAGLQTPIAPAFLSSRTPLFHQLAGAVLSLRSDYWIYQLVTVVLNSLWLWPAGLLLERAGGGRGRLLAMALSPFLVAYAVYTWPWAFAACFMLAATYLCTRDGRLAAVATGVAMGGAFLAHPGTTGYLVGLAIFILARHRNRALPTLGAAVVTAASQLPWTYVITNGAGPLGVAFSVDPVVQRVPLDTWVITRLLVLAHSFMPAAPLVRGVEVVDIVLVFLVLSLPGALLAATLAARRWLRPTGPAAWMILAGAIFGILVVPPQQFSSGMLDTLYPGIMLVLVGVSGAVPARVVPRLLGLQAALAAVFVAALLLVATRATIDDPNLRLKLAYEARFAVEQLTPFPGIAALGLAAVSAFLALRNGPGTPSSEGSSP